MPCHVEAGDVGGVVGEELVELSEGGIALAEAVEFDGEAVAGEGVGGILFEDGGEGGYFVHGARITAVTGKMTKATMATEYAGQTGITRAVSDSQSEMTELVLPNDTNTLGNLLGGRLMHFIDLVGAMAAYRHSRSHVVTASMDHIDFIAPVHVGDLLILKSSCNRAFRTSMEIGVKAEVENTMAGVRRHVASAYLTFVAVDPQGRKVPVAQLRPESAEEIRRYEDAGHRREIREAERERRKTNREGREKLKPA